MTKYVIIPSITTGKTRVRPAVILQRLRLGVSAILLLMVGLSLFPAAGVQAAGSGTITPPAGYRKLKDINIFTGTSNGSYTFAGGGLYMESIDSTLHNGDTSIPIDPNQVYNNDPSYRFNIINPYYGYWGAGIAKGWNTFSIKNYVAHGFLEFNVKGQAGNEQFNIGLSDSRYERSADNGGQNLFLTRPISAYTTLSTDWQHVKIPLTDIAGQNTNFATDAAQTVSLSGGGPGPLEFWLNDIKVTSPDNEPAYPAIKVNQVGYTTQAEKYALVSGFQEDISSLSATTAFYLKRTSDNSTVFTGHLKLVSDYDVVSGERVFQADFSPFHTAGSYYVTVDGSGIDNSLVFQIGDDIYDNLVRDSLRFYYYQRQGIALDAAHAGDYTRGVGHPQDAQAILRSSVQGSDPVTRTIDVSHGWYDAGDYGKYVSFAGPAVNDLLWTYETYKAQFGGDGFLNIPESGNGKSDLLDEVKWELDWVQEMQDQATGGFYHLVYPNNYNGTPDKDPRNRYVEDCDVISNSDNPEATVVGPRCGVEPTADTADGVAMLAHASVIYRTDYDAGYAQTMLTAAKKGWDYLTAHPAQVVVQGQNGGAETADADDRLWAAAALYRATNDPKYNQYFLAHYQDNQLAKWWTSKTDSAYIDEGSLAMLAMLQYMKASHPDRQAVEWFSKQFATWRQTMLDRQSSLAWHNFLLPSAPGVDSDYFWGSNEVTLEIPLVLTVGSQELHNYDQTITQATRENLNYILGLNPVRKSYVSGYGSDSVSRVYSNFYNFDGRPGLPKGIITGGANSNEGSAYSNFQGKDYGDTGSDWVVNEIAIYWNSPLVFSAAAVASTGRQAVLNPTADTTVIKIGDNQISLGTTPDLAVGGIPNYRETSYLKFDLTGLNSVGSATLRLYGTSLPLLNLANLQINLASSDNWTESNQSGLKNFPGPIGQPVIGKLSDHPGYYEWDVSSLVKGEWNGDKLVSLVLSAPSNRIEQLLFNSRGNTSFKPELLVTP